MTTFGQDIAGTLGKQITEAGGVRTTDLDNQGAYVGVSVAQNQRGELRESDVALQPTTGGGKPGEGYPAMRAGSTVRRLTPVECERLMSWPDGWTAVDGPDTPDGRRYAACGDGVVSNVSEWIARRILVVDGMVAA